MEQQSSLLRAELKQWERDFAVAHGGRKAGREDIKQEPDIAKKYKAYDKLRRNISQSSKYSQTVSPTTSKRPFSADDSQHDSSQTPSKRAKSSQHLLQPWAIDPYDPPLSTLFSPSRARTSIGPTPQKDGRVLGIFDVLSSGSASKTPSKRKALLPISVNEQSTPSKHRNDESKPADQSQEASAAKRKYHVAIGTPSRHRNGHLASPNANLGSRKSQNDETPLFLRRGGQIPKSTAQAPTDGNEDGTSWSPVAVRKLALPIGRGLSALVKGLREMEDKALDDDLDMLREMETDSLPTNAPANALQNPSIRVISDSQVPDLPLGPDCAIESSEDDGEVNKRNNRVIGRKWKKKGQKRTTRKVVMKPNTARWKPEPKWESEHDSGVEMGPDSVEMIAKTQMQGPMIVPKLNEDLDEAGSGAEGGEGEGEGEKDARISLSDSKNKAPCTRRAQAAVAKASEAGGTVTQRVKKKISATAHANFRALKIKNKNSKGKKGGRFGRRRPG